MWRMTEKLDEGYGCLVLGDIAHCIHLTEHRVLPRASMVAVKKRITGTVAADKRITGMVL
jgi:hypothetical protein